MVDLLGTVNNVVPMDRFLSPIMEYDIKLSCDATTCWGWIEFLKSWESEPAIFDSDFYFTWDHGSFFFEPGVHQSFYRAKILLGWL